MAAARQSRHFHPPWPSAALWCSELSQALWEGGGWWWATASAAGLSVGQAPLPVASTSACLARLLICDAVTPR
eukprot:71982-Pyramimonas_sp.AAC.1